ncbi:MAG: 30S ribosomal protein S21 [Candidatus Vogelbacteria bacterium]|nr:30S ribosomal protein S21 [Candidatus Vogelbacteria bacterium]
MTTHAVRVEVKRNAGETAPSLIRRFSRRVQEANVVRQAKSRRYYTRPSSKTAQKARALRRIENQKKNSELRKLGKLDVLKKKRSR